MLSKQQIEQLFVFCRKHYVQYYDVQVELVDHLVNAIEDKMNEDKNLSFEYALNKVYAGFGIKGFADIVASQQKAVDKQCVKMRWNLYRSYFTPPKCILTACIFLSFIFIKINTNIYYDYILAILFFALFVLELIFILQAKKNFKKQKQKLLFVQWNPYTIYSFVNFYFAQALGVFNGKAISNLNYYFIAASFTLNFIAVLAYRNYVRRLFYSAKTQYPQVFA